MRNNEVIIIVMQHYLTPSNISLLFQEWLYNFRKCAEEFLIEGQPTDKLCDHNYEVINNIM